LQKDSSEEDESDDGLEFKRRRRTTSTETEEETSNPPTTSQSCQILEINKQKTARAERQESCRVPVVARLGYPPRGGLMDRPACLVVAEKTWRRRTVSTAYKEETTNPFQVSENKKQMTRAEYAESCEAPVAAAVSSDTEEDFKPVKWDFMKEVRTAK